MCLLFMCTYSRFEDLQFNWIRIECKVCNSPADNNTFQLAQVALDGLLQSESVQFLIINQSSVASGMSDKKHIPVNHKNIFSFHCIGNLIL